jgi:hypothetical protein
MVNGSRLTGILLRGIPEVSYASPGGEQSAFTKKRERVILIVEVAMETQNITLALPRKIL